MSQSYLDKTGLQYFWGKVKAEIPATYAGSSSAGGAADKTASIPYGTVASSSTSTAYTATVDGITELSDGVCVMLKNGVVTSAAGFTINVNGLGAKPVYNSMAAATAETTLFNVNYTMLFVYDSTRVSGGCWVMYRGYNSDTTTGREEYYYLRPYAGQAVYRYKFLMQGENGRFYPIVTTDQSSATQVTKSPTTVGLRPWKIWYYTGTATVSSGAAFAAQTVQPSYYITTAVYNFNASTGTYAYIFLQGSYDKDTDLFTLDTGNNYYKFVRYNTAINWASSLTSGKYYILLGASYSTTNYVQLFNVNPFYYFDGTRLVPIYKKVAQDLMPSKTSDLINDSGYITSASLPTKVSDLDNDSGFITGYTETDPTVPAWAKAASKPTYTASEVGALPSSTSYVSSFNGNTGAVTYTAPVSSVNGNTGAVTVVEGMTPLIGDVDEINPYQVKVALGEGRAVCISAVGQLEGVNLDLRFTSWNGATDYPYDGALIDVVVSQTIAYYDGVYYLFELIGAVVGGWQVLSTIIAQGSDIPTKKYWYGECSTSASTQNKVVTTSTGDFAGNAGDILRVRFDFNQNYDGAPTMSVDNAVAGNVYEFVNSTGSTLSYGYKGMWHGGEVVDFYYDGNGRFIALGKNRASASCYGVVKISTSVSSNDDAVAATSSAVKAAYDLADSKQEALVSGTNIKTINNTSILGSGNITISGGATAMTEAEVLAAVQAGWSPAS